MDVRVDRLPALAKAGWVGLLVAALALGIYFRCAHLGDKVYWVDEVATSLRSAGYTRSEAIAQLTRQQRFTAADLQRYRQLDPQRGWGDTLTALRQSPEHAPLYFLLVRAWRQQFGSSAAAIRSLSVLTSVLSLAAIGWLARELFGAARRQSIALAVLLMAVSPFFVAYAQEARPYSLWTLTLLLSGGLLLRSLRLSTRSSWSWYALSLVLALYTSLLSGFVAIGQSLYVLRVAGWRHPHLRAQLTALAASLVAFLPWLVVIGLHWQQLGDNTTWMRSPMPAAAMVAVWLYSIVILFGDFPVELALTPVTVLAVITDLALLALIGYSLSFCRSPQSVGLYLLSWAIAPLGLVCLDLAFGGQSSATPRYLMPMHIGILLAVAHCLAGHWHAAPRSVWRGMTVALVVLGVASCFANLEQSPLYQKDQNRANPAIAAVINQAAQPVLWVEPSQTMDLMSLGDRLNADAEIELGTFRPLPAVDRCRNVFLLNPSPELLTAVQQTFGARQRYQPNLLTPFDAHLALWQIEPTSSCAAIAPIQYSLEDDSFRHSLSAIR